MKLLELHLHIAPGGDRDLDAHLLKAVTQLEDNTMALFTELKTKVDGLIQHVDEMDAKLQSVKQQLADFVANATNAGSLSAQDASDLGAIIASIDTEDAKVVADTLA